MASTTKIQSEQHSNNDNGSISSAKTHLARNTLSNVIFFLFNVVTSLYMLPYQIRHLGIGNYGIIFLAIQFVSYTQILSMAIVGAISRFVVLHASKGDNEEARSYLTTQVIAITWLAALLIPAAMLISFLTPRFLNLPSGQAANTQILFFIMYLAFLTSLFTSVFQVSLFVRQRFDLKNLIEIINQIFRYSTWILLFAILTPRIWHIGVGTFAGALVALVASLIVFNKLTPELRPSLKGFDKGKFLEMVKTGAWMTVAQLGWILYIAMDTLIINKILGPTSAGNFATIAGIQTMLRTLSSTMLVLVVPPAVACFARQDWDGLMRGSARALKFTSLSYAILFGIICGLSVPFLTCWLGPKFAPLSLLTWLMLSHLVLNNAADPLFFINYAMNRVAVPGIATVIGGVIKVGLAITLVKFTSLGLYGIPVADIFCLGMKNLVFAPIYTGKVVGRSPLPLYKALFPSVFIFAATSATALKLTHIFKLTSFFDLLCVGAPVAIVFALITYFIALTDDDRTFFKQVIQRKNQKPAA